MHTARREINESIYIYTYCIIQKGGLTSSRSQSISEIKLGLEFTGATQRFLPRRRLKSLAAPPLRQHQRRRPSDRGWTLLQWRYRGCPACVDRDRTSARKHLYRIRRITKTVLIVL